MGCLVDAVPVLARGHNAAVFLPPVVEAARPLLAAIAARPLLVLAPDTDRAAQLSALLDGVTAVTGLARAEQRLRRGTPESLGMSLADALALMHRSALAPAGFAAIVLAWPEQLDAEGKEALATVMAEADKEAQRLILTSETGAPGQQLIERYAFKAMTYGFPNLDPGAPTGPVGAARYVIARADLFADTRRRILDSLIPENDDAVTIARTPVSRDEAVALVERAGGEPAVIVAEAYELPWLRSLFAPLTHVVLPTAADAADSRAEKLRTRVARVVEGENLDRELFMVAPLFERYDPALVAAALLRIVQASQGAAPAARIEGPAVAASGVPAFAKVWVGAGRKDNVKPGDIVGAIVNEAKVPSESLGKIDVRELFCLVEVRADRAEQVAKGLTGVQLRGRRLTARVDRGPGPGHRPPRRV